VSYIIRVSLSKINNLLLAVIIVLDLYVIFAPLLPSLIFNIESHGNRRQVLQKIISAGNSTNSQFSNNTVNENSLIVPAMLLNEPIREGSIAQQYQILNQGIWRWPDGSTPDKGGNTVLIGHRFTYTIPKGAFYYLNKLQVGDQIGVFWNKKEYVYQVTNISIVPPTDTAIEQSTSKPELTMFTCTPLLIPKDRLVVVADLESK
jgi:LPXTG-site transpeptidase (sortase) family protein